MKFEEVKSVRRKSLSEVQRAQMVTLRGEELSKRQISIKIKFRKTAVHQAIMKFQLYSLCKDLKRSGRPRRTRSSRPPDETDSHKVVNMLRKFELR